MQIDHIVLEISNTFFNIIIVILFNELDFF